MSDLGLLATRLAHTTAYAESLDRALLNLKRGADGRDRMTLAESLEARKMMREMLSDLIRVLKGELVSGCWDLPQETVEILRGSLRQDWQAFVRNLETALDRLDKSEEELTQEELENIECVANALDDQCSKLFERMRGRFR